MIFLEADWLYPWVNYRSLVMVILQRVLSMSNFLNPEVMKTWKYRTRFNTESLSSHFKINLIHRENYSLWIRLVRIVINFRSRKTALKTHSGTQNSLHAPPSQVFKTHSISWQPWLPVIFSHAVDQFCVSSTFKLLSSSVRKILSLFC